MSEKTDGQILIHCFAGCPLDEVLKALKLSKSDLFPNRKRHPSIAFRYGYYDESYHLLYENVRLTPKGFYQRRPDGAGEWINDLSGVRRVLYRLPEVLQAERVMIFEGEKDCRTIRKLEKFLSFPFVATTSGGADTWNPEFADCLRGKDVVVIADKDAAGAKFRRNVVRSLQATAASLKVAKLPVGKDVTAWIEAGESLDWEGAIEQLEQFISEAPELRRRRLGDYEAAILAYLDGEGKTLQEIRGGVKGKTCDLDKALRRLCARGDVQRRGVGVRNSPFQYSLSRFPLLKGSSPRDTHFLRNVLQPSKRDSDRTRMNSESILVPNFSNAEFLKMESESEKGT